MHIFYTKQHYFSIKRKTFVITFFIFILIVLICHLPTLQAQEQKSKTIEDSTTTTSKKNKQKSKSRIKEKSKENADYFEANFLRYEDYIYNPNIKTILFNKLGWELSPPLIELGSDEQLEVRFDDLSNQLKTLKYTIIHCNADWTPSDLLWNEYIQGFQDEEIRDYQYSFNTIQKYIHYHFIFPTVNMKPVLSGNYLLKVYEDGYADAPLFTRRFMIFESKVNINGLVKQATNVEDMKYKQEVDFSIFANNYTLYNPYSNLKIVIQQNNRWDNAITQLKPRFVKGNELVYDYENENVFNGGNEFRIFDVKSVRNQSMRIHKILFDTSGYHVYLQGDEKRTFKTYYSYRDINGARVIRTEDFANNNIESEYVYVHFVLPYPAPIVEGGLYVFGALTDWKFTKEAQLKYNYDWKVYETAIYLKQGYYDYQYVLLENGKTVGDETFIEGNHWETENDYTILVYYREQGTLYDKLIGVKKLNSIRK